MNYRQWVVDVILVQTPSRWRRVQNLVVRTPESESGVSKTLLASLPYN
jgi:hypothetical protein